MIVSEDKVIDFIFAGELIDELVQRLFLATEFIDLMTGEPVSA